MMKNYSYLTIDDDDGIRGFVERSLRHAGVTQMYFAANGEEGLALAEEKRPDLIILDVKMPAANGLSILRRLKNSETTGNIPVLMATGEVDFKTICDDRHAAAVLSKPFTQRQLIELITEILLPRQNAESGEPALRVA